MDRNGENVNFVLQTKPASKCVDNFDELADLRIQIFKEFPYLYDGDIQYEKKYMGRYLDSKSAVFILVYWLNEDEFKKISELKPNQFEFVSKNIINLFTDIDLKKMISSLSGKLVGMATALSLSEEMPSIKNPYESYLNKHNINIENVFYFGESLLIQKYRGNGIGKLFFQLREMAALNWNKNLQLTTFCAVDRPNDHEKKPVSYQDLSLFWNNLGYQKIPDLITSLSWKDIDCTIETDKKMIFWKKSWKV